MTPRPAGISLPPAPRTFEGLGLPAMLVQNIVLKTLHYAGDVSGSDLAARLGVFFSAIDDLLNDFKREHLVAIGGGGVGPQSYTYRLTDAGHERALAAIAQNHYVGTLPVPLTQYRAYMASYSRHGSPQVTPRRVREALAHLVLSERMLDQLGPAIVSRHSLFLYGPPGNGKTAIAQGLGGLLAGTIGIPHALSIDGEIIRIFDPMNHRELERAVPPSIGADPPPDARWVRCQRPVITVGGELTLEALELGYVEGRGFYRAPVQMLASGGILVIDDFGRQRVSPRELLNRWIVPLETRVDHLVLRSGQKFEVPFEVLVIFASNLQPHEVLDESFLRRIRHKVFAGSPTKHEFIRIFERCCEQRGLSFERDMVEALITRELEPREVPLRGCQPRDLIDHALSLGAYLDQPNELTVDLLEAACSTYFLDNVWAHSGRP